jgi:multicomponent Na+:H+ antiporter subunit D
MAMLLLARGEHEGAALLAMAGGLYHLLNHAVFKGLLFLNAGALEHRLETRDLKAMGGLQKAMPVTGTTSLMASLSISGLPPFNGFFSKLIIIVAAIYGRFYLLAALAVLVSIITLAYFLKFQRFAFFNREALPRKGKIREVPFSMQSSMVILAVLCLALSLLFLPRIRDTVFMPAVESLVQSEITSITLSGI